MLKSLGLIETRSFIGSIAAADAILKCPDIKIIGKEHMAGGEVVLIIEGELASLKVALESGSEKARELGQLKSFYIIPEPKSELVNIFGEFFSLRNHNEKRKNVLLPETSDVIKEGNSVVDETVRTGHTQNQNLQANRSGKVKTKLKKDKKTNEPFLPVVPQSNDTINRLRREALDSFESVNNKELYAENQTKISIEKAAESGDPKQYKDPIKNVMHEELDSMNVHQLRRLARSTSGFPIKGREISKANRNELLDYFIKLS